ncbi:cell division cycle-associated protein 7-like isoform X2 [Durio zibethinus]|uniref:Cell division cycle-associated protein 7-like isoform X2 n=1 Tax=Durio zibethinus TaxID=66656 RepID=A0A6P5Z1F9_DURZI|nr:cell division cycle-associated protein 7-like isoform X2 [Durio zibethinus]
MGRKRRRIAEKGKGEEYEKWREQRIKENKGRMQKLGILDLSLKLKPKPPPQKIPRNLPSSDDKAHNSLPVSQPTRRSSRLKTLAPVSYVENRKPKFPENDEVEIHLEEGPKPEIYTEEHEMLLGDCEMSWTLLVDGYGNDGKRIYDPVKGETCHQCRQKTLGHRTHCSKCKLVQGQLCGDCLYTRYGENVIEANQNHNWICPVCRGICNCSLCRQEKGWRPTGAIYRKNLSRSRIATFFAE